MNDQPSDGALPAPTFFEDLVENAHDLIQSVQDDGRIAYANRRWCEVLGYTRADVPGLTLADIIHPDSAAHCAAVFERVQAGETATDIEAEFVTKDGRPVPVQGTAGRLTIDGRSLTRGIFRDITARRSRQARLLESEERFRQLVTHIPEAFWVNSLIDHSVEFVSPAYERIWGRTCEALYDDPGQWLEGIHPEDRAGVQALFTPEALLAGDFDVEYRVVRPDGAVRWIRDRGFPIPSAAGPVERIAGIAADMTEAKESERVLRDVNAELERRVQERTAELQSSTARLQASEARFSALFNESIDPILLFDLDGGIVGANVAAEAEFRADRKALQGRTVLDLHPPAGRQAARAAWTQTLESDVRGVELVLLRADGTEFPAEVSARVVSVGEERFVQGIARNIETRKQLEAQFAQAQKLDAIGRLAGGIAHDFNNQLSAVLGFGQLMLRSLAAEDPARDDLQQVLRAGEKAAAITRQLLAFSRKQRLEPRTVELHDIVTDAERMLGRLIGEHIELSVVRGSGDHRAHVDAGQLDQAILNLAINARDAMPTGGTLKITTASADLDAAYAASHPEVTPGRFAVVSVSDTGTGMDAETRAQVFEPFFTTKPAGEGTGLGLAMVHGFVTQSGGHLSVESAPGRGTTFQMYFPAIDAPASSEAVEAATPAAGGTETILVVEDDETVRALAERTLQDAGYHVLVAADGVEALRLCDDHEADLHLLVSDVVMPRMSGVAVAEQVRKRRPGVRTILMSGYNEEAIARFGEIGPATAYLSKPLTPATLLRKVRTILDAE